MFVKLTLLIFVYCVGASALFAERQPFDRYQSIVDRQMFGALPPGFDPTKMPSEVSKADQKQLTKEQEKLQSAIHFSVINVDAKGDVHVGFTDKSNPKEVRNYFLKAGESRDGWTVKEADAETATMTIVKGEIEVTLSLGGNSAKDAGATTKAGGGAATTFASARSSLLNGGSLLSRRRMRAQRNQEEQEKKAAAAAAAAAHEEERQAKAEAEKAEREAERAEQRRQLQAIQEELRRAREARVAEEQKQRTQEEASAAESETHDEN